MEWDEGGRFAFIAETRRCAGCELLEMERENVAAEEKGVKYFLMKNLHKDDELEE